MNKITFNPHNKILKTSEEIASQLGSLPYDILSTNSDIYIEKVLLHTQYELLPTDEYKVSTRGVMYNHADKIHPIAQINRDHEMFYLYENNYVAISNKLTSNTPLYKLYT